MKIISYSRNVTVTDPDGTASANEITPGQWWINRVLVHEGSRGKGLGSKMVEALIDACIEQKAKRIEVAPGGYNADPKRQKSFYLKLGFKPEGKLGLFVMKMSND